MRLVQYDICTSRYIIMHACTVHLCLVTPTVCKLGLICLVYSGTTFWPLYRGGLC